ncbi:hypothetical protein [Streptomyces sp. NPDC085596]|uniref:hypothetical protein n=1 Tax=Streptomyces sp. NPDC085596 TaxID=3365731 RepID=UPI0037CF0149
MKKSSAIKAAITTAFAAALAFSIVTPAQATTTKWCTLMQGTAGYGCFYSDGDKFAVQDYIADGKRVILWWTLINGPQEGRSGSCTDADGAANGFTWCDYDFPEGSNYAVTFATTARDGANGKDEHPNNPLIIGYVSGHA